MEAHKANNDYYFGNNTPQLKIANDLMASLEYSGVLSDKFLSYIYNCLYNMLYCLDNNDIAGGKTIYININEFLDRYSLFSETYKLRVRAPFASLLNSITEKNN